MRLMIDSGEIDAARAQRMNMIDWCVPASELEAQLQHVIQAILEGPSLAFGRFKALGQGLGRRSGRALGAGALGLLCRDQVA
ncbi:hypothetical protein D9M68_806260 [compost metagenome]